MDSAASLQLDLQRHTLDNGLRVILHRDPSLPLVAINLWYHVGSKNERPGRTGFAHLFEHMLFQGSEHVPANGHFRFIQQAGGVANGSTWYDRTSYYQTLPAHHLALGLWLESDRMGFLLPAMTQEKLDNQRDVVMNERCQRVDNQPYGRAGERLYELLFPEEHPYHWPVIGYMEDLAAATLDDVQEFFSIYYSPGNAVLTLAGDFEDEPALQLIDQYFAPIPSGPEIPELTATLPETIGERRETLEDNVQLPRIYLGYAVPAYGDEDWYGADLLSTVLTSGKSSLLYRDLVYERQIAQEVGCHVSSTEECATFSLVSTATPGVDIEELESALSHRLEQVASKPVSDRHVERAKNRLLTGYFTELQSLDRRADLLSQFTTYFDDPHRLPAELETYNRLQSADLQRVAQEFLKPDNRVSLTVSPRNPRSSEVRAKQR